MKPIVLSCLFVSIQINSVFGQYLKMEDLISFCTSQSWVETNELLNARGWSFDGSKTEENNPGKHYDVIDWSWGKNGNRATSWLTISFRKGGLTIVPPSMQASKGNKVFYIHSNEAEYNSLIKALKLNTSEVTYSEVLTDKLVIVYSWREFDFKFTVSKDKYEILVYQKNRNSEPSLFQID